MNILNETKCRVCQSNHFKKWGERDAYTLYQCQNCDLVFFYPYPTQEELTEFYNQGYHQERGYSGQTKAGELRQVMYQLDIDDLQKHIPSSGKFLDVGCAEGSFLSALPAQWERYGMDVSEKALISARERNENINYFSGELDTIDVEDHYFDIIHLRGVFEHMLYPDEMIKKIKKKLKSGGMMVLSNTPNIKSVCARLYRGRYKLILPNEHVNYFSNKTIKILCQQNGLSVTHVSYPYFNTPYESLIKDAANLLINLISAKQSPPFYGNIFTIYATNTL